MSESISYKDTVDSDGYTEENGEKIHKTDFISITTSLIKNINYKMGLFLFFVCMIIFSNLFNDKVLTMFDNATYNDCANSKGTIIQITMLVLVYLILDLIQKAGWI